MRKALFAVALLTSAISLSGCWDHRGGYDHPGYPSDHHHHHHDG